MGKSDISHKDLIFRDGIGQKATVHRETMSMEKASVPNRMLKDLAAEVQKSDDKLKHYDYLGSACVHIFYNHILEHIAFASQTEPLVDQLCPEILASKAFDDLLGTMKAMYGHKRGKLRSGF